MCTKVKITIDSHYRMLGYGERREKLVTERYHVRGSNQHKVSNFSGQTEKPTCATKSFIEINLIISSDFVTQLSLLF